MKKSDTPIILDRCSGIQVINGGTGAVLNCNGIDGMECRVVEVADAGTGCTDCTDGGCTENGGSALRDVGAAEKGLGLWMSDDPRWQEFIMRIPLCETARELAMLTVNVMLVEMEVSKTPMITAESIVCKAFLGNVVAKATGLEKGRTVANLRSHINKLLTAKTMASCREEQKNIGKTLGGLEKNV